MNPLDNALVCNRKIYEKFGAKNNVSNKTYLSNLYSDEILYYNDPNVQKKKSLKKYLTLGFVALTSLSAIGMTIVGIITNKNKIPQIGQNIEKTTKSLFSKLENGIVNACNIKDDLWDIFSKKFKKGPLGFIDNSGERLRKTYTSWSKAPFEKDFEEALNGVRKATGKQQIEGLPESFNKWFSQIDESILDKLHNGENGRITKNLVDFKNLLKHPILEIKSIWQKLTSEIISNNRIQDVYTQTLKDIEVPQGATEELKEAIKKYNTTKNNCAEKLIPRLRDTNLGNASTDALGMVASLLILTVELENTENKE